MLENKKRNDDDVGMGSLFVCDRLKMYFGRRKRYYGRTRPRLWTESSAMKTCSVCVQDPGTAFGCSHLVFRGM